MTFRIVILPRAKRQLYESALWWSEHHSTEQAIQWLNGFEAALAALKEKPTHHNRAIEDEEFTDRTIRQMLYGLSRKKTHRVLFEVCGQDVVVYAIRHLAQSELDVEDFERGSAS